MKIAERIDLKLLTIFSLILVMSALLLQAFDVNWQYHLRVDIDGQYMSHARHFLKNHNLNSLGYNEYQPGAILFFVALSPVLLLINSADIYLVALILVNLFLIFIMSFIYKNFSGVLGLFIFLLIILLTGPIALYRFDLFTFLFILLAVWMWQKSHLSASFFFLGIATMIKIYPALLVPYLIIISYKNNLGMEKLASHFFAFFGGVISIILVYLIIFQGNLAEVISAFVIHSRKPVHIESIWGSLLTIFSKLTTGSYALGRGDVGIFGIAKEYTVGSLHFYNYFWILILGFFYLILFLKLKKNTKIDFRICLSLILLFLVFSKILAPQYTLWFTLFFPLFKISLKGKWLVDFFLILTIAFLSQYIYPLRYNELLAGFYSQGTFVNLFYLLALRNLMLCILLYRMLRGIKWVQN